jgi:hypothetical protein
VERYRALRTDADLALEEVFQRHFADWVDPEPTEISDEAPH